MAWGNLVSTGKTPHDILLLAGVIVDDKQLLLGTEYEQVKVVVNVEQDGDFG